MRFPVCGEDSPADGWEENEDEEAKTRGEGEYRHGGGQRYIRTVSQCFIRSQCARASDRLTWEIEL